MPDGEVSFKFQNISETKALYLAEDRSMALGRHITDQ